MREERNFTGSGPVPDDRSSHSGGGGSGDPGGKRLGIVERLKQECKYVAIYLLVVVGVRSGSLLIVGLEHWNLLADLIYVLTVVLVAIPLAHRFMEREAKGGK